MTFNEINTCSVFIRQTDFQQNGLIGEGLTIGTAQGSLIIEGLWGLGFTQS
jgi:hypothetical protein